LLGMSARCEDEESLSSTDGQNSACGNSREPPV
jgi:hypothetical protein